MAHRRSSRAAHEKVIDTIRWGGARHAMLALSAGAVAQTMITDGTQVTIMRIRGELYSGIDGTQTGASTVDVAVGALVVQAGSSTTIIQKPITDPDAPWLFYERWTLNYEEMVTDVVANPGGNVFRKTIDSKAMRILREGREVQLVTEQATLSGSADVNTVVSFRVLLGIK